MFDAPLKVHKGVLNATDENETRVRLHHENHHDVVQSVPSLPDIAKKLTNQLLLCQDIK